MPVLVALLTCPLPDAGAEEAKAPGLETLVEIRAGEGLLRTLAWTPDGRHLAGGSSDRTVWLWRPPQREPTRTVTFPRYG